MLDIIYQDRDLLVVNKPADLLCVPGLSHSDNLFDRIRTRFPNVRTVHRLDMATSGLVIFALNHPSQKSLGKQFEQRKIKKQYLAVVSGALSASSGEIVMPLICDWPNRPRQIVDWQGGKSAHTVFKRLQINKHSSLLQLHPITGRSHQLRVHCQAIGHAILGDGLYNPEDPTERLMLHAESIQFTHPSTGELCKFECAAEFARAL